MTSPSLLFIKEKLSLLLPDDFENTETPGRTVNSIQSVLLYEAHRCVFSNMHLITSNKSVETAQRRKSIQWTVFKSIVNEMQFPKKLTTLLLQSKRDTFLGPETADEKVKRIVKTFSWLDGIVYGEVSEPEIYSTESHSDRVERLLKDTESSIPNGYVALAYKIFNEGKGISNNSLPAPSGIDDIVRSEVQNIIRSEVQNTQMASEASIHVEDDHTIAPTGIAPTGTKRKRSVPNMNEIKDYLEVLESLLRLLPRPKQDITAKCNKILDALPSPFEDED